MKRDFLFFAIYLYLYIIMNWTKVKPSGIVHIFAALHAVVTILCRAAGIGDELFLTILTMTMIILVCLRKNLNLEFSAVIIIVINVIGYILGTAGANLIGVFFESDLAIHAISTALTTELLGWGTIFIGDIMFTAHGIVYIANMFVFTMMALAMAFLIGNIVSNKNALNGIVNVVALGSSFLCGAFVPREWLPDVVSAIGHMFPSYYYIATNDLLKSMEEINVTTL